MRLSKIANSAAEIDSRSVMGSRKLLTAKPGEYNVAGTRVHVRTVWVLNLLDTFYRVLLEKVGRSLVDLL